MGGTSIRVFETGGLGFTGAALAKRLLETGHSVSVLDNKRGLFHDELEQAGAEIELGSILDPEVVARNGIEKMRENIKSALG